MQGLIDWLKGAYAAVYDKSGLVGVVVITLLLAGLLTLAWYLGVFG